MFLENSIDDYESYGRVCRRQEGYLEWLMTFDAPMCVYVRYLAHFLRNVRLWCDFETWIATDIENMGNIADVSKIDRVKVDYILKEWSFEILLFRPKAGSMRDAKAT